MKVEIYSGKSYVGIIANENVYLDGLEKAIRALMVARRHLKKETKLDEAKK